MIRPNFLHDLVSVVAFKLVETSAGPHSSILVYLLDCLQLEALSAVATELACYSFGLVTGLARETYCLAAVPKACPALRRTQQLVVQLLHPLKQRGLAQKSFPQYERTQATLA